MQGLVGFAAVPRMVNWFTEVAIVLKSQPAVEEFDPLKSRWAALPIAPFDGQVREEVTKIGCPAVAEFVSSDGLKRCWLEAQLVVNGVKVNSGDVPAVETLYIRHRETPPTLIA